jgi:hypothetical protein
MRRLLAVGLVALVLSSIGVASPAAACACGGITPPPHSSVKVFAEQAIVNWDGKTESIQMMLDAQSTATQTGLIVPTPSPATVTEGDRELFGVLERLIAPREHVSDDWWGTSLLPTTGVGAPPIVVKQVKLGPIEATTLLASDTQGLTQWLLDNGFTISPELTSALLNYVSIGWSFVVLKLAGEHKLTGSLGPIKLSFHSERLVYPMALSRLATSPQDLRLYVLDQQRDMVVQATRPTLELDARVSVVWAGKVTNPDLRPLGKYLTVIDVVFDDPGEQVRGDIGILVGSDLSDVQPTIEKFRLIALLGVPVGSLIVGWASFGLLLVIVYLAWRRRTS